MTPRIPRQRSDEGVSSLIGFIAAMAILSASTGLAVYFIMTTPEKGTSPQARELDRAAARAAETLAKTPGDPTDWDDKPLSELRATGLLDPATQIATQKKIREIQDGNLTATRFLESLNLQAEGITLDATGTIVPVPALEPPTAETYIVANATSLSEDPVGEDLHVDVDLASDSQKTLTYFDAATPGASPTQNNWTITDLTVHPSTLTGNVVPDDPWFIENQLLPRMAGIESVDTIAEQGPGDSRSEAGVQAMRDYHQGDTESARFRILAENQPWDLPGSRDADMGDYALLLGSKKKTGGVGLGLWRVPDGAKSWALLGGFNTKGSVDTELSFEHLLSAQEGGICQDDTDTNCVDVRPSIMFWNQTAGQWSPLQASTPTCPQHAWDDEGTAEGSSSWTQKTVDLCQAEQHGGDKLWLALAWRTDCLDNNRDPTPCNTNQNRQRVWAIDNMQLTIETQDGTQKTLWSTGFEPGKRAARELLVFAQGVDYTNYQQTPAIHRGTSYNYTRLFVENRGNVIAYTPGTAGDWMGQIGLEAIPRPAMQTTTTHDPDSIAMNMPNPLPVHDDAYAAASLVWNNASTPTNPAGGSPPAGFTPLTAIQSTNDDQTATYLLGDPYQNSGRVLGIAYDLPTFNKTNLRADLIENTYVASIFDDPTFDLDGAIVPESGTTTVRTSQRIMLAQATDDGAFQIPLKVTVYAWPVARN